MCLNQDTEGGLVSFAMLWEKWSTGTKKKQNVPPPNLLYLEYDTLKSLDDEKCSVFLV